MQLLFVSRSNTGQPHPFIKEQADNLIRNFNLKINHLLISQGGINGYYLSFKQLRSTLKNLDVDIIHVHYGLWAPAVLLYKLLFRAKFKVIITFHGSDINKKSERIISIISAHFAAHNILVSPKMNKYIKSKYSVIPCGIDVDITLGLREAARKEYQWKTEDFVILFSSSFNRKVKDPEFAFRVIDAFSKLSPRSVRFIELKGYSRSQLTRLMQAADVMLVCSISEGSPQVVKESILNSLPIIANNVGDIETICKDVDNCFIIKKEIEEYIKYLLWLSETNARVENRLPVIEYYDNKSISKQVFKVYQNIVFPAQFIKQKSNV